MTTTTDPPLTVLLAEDNPNDATLIKRYIRTADTAFLPDDIEIHHETDLGSAVDMLETAEIDLFLLDLGLPESSGPETYHRVSDRTKRIPVIVLTGLQDEQAAVDLLQEGAQDYLNKESLSRGRLVKSIRYALERQEREAELRTKTDQLELLNRLLRHDIQNDLQIIRGWTETAAAEATAKTTDQLQRVLETSKHTLELTENSQKLIRLVADEDEIERDTVRLDTILQKELNKAETTHPDTEFCYDEPLPTVTIKATEMLSSVFRNLINNAVQHNDSENPVVDLSIDLEGQVVQVKIADNGQGVPDTEKETIFGKDEKGLESEGTGIGLYLVNTLVTEFDGRVWVTDNEPSGAIFTVELPTSTDVDPFVDN